MKMRHDTKAWRRAIVRTLATFEGGCARSIAHRLASPGLISEGTVRRHLNALYDLGVVKKSIMPGVRMWKLNVGEDEEFYVTKRSYINARR